jgi:hypothetical protein
MKRKRIHLLSAVNAKNVSKSGGTYTIREVCGATDGIVMNGVLYAGDQLESSIDTLEGKPAPAGHPKNTEGHYISALHGDALLNSYMGAVCRNARHEGGRSLVDVVINEAQARAHPDGVKLIERLDNAISGADAEPIHVSTGLLTIPVQANGESRGKKYTRIATNIEYDHLAILLHEQGAGKPDQGVGMFLNADGQPEEIEVAEVNTDPDDRRFEGLTGWIRKLLGNADLSFDQISSGLYKGLQDGNWLAEVFDKYAIYSDRDNRMWRQDYSVGSDGSVAWQGQPIEVKRAVSYEAVSNRQTESDPMKDHILAALNAAGVQTTGMDDAGLLQAYNALQAKPHADALAAVNAKLAEIQTAARNAEEAEAATLAAELAVNSSLTVDDLKKLGVNRLKELKAKAAPVTPGGAAQPGDEFKAYSLNAFLETSAK